MKNAWIALAGLVCCALVQAVEMNPYSTAKVGDWLSYKMSTSMGGFSNSIETKKTVTKKTDTEITLEGTTNVMGHDSTTTQTIPLNRSFDPMQQYQGPGAEAKVL